MTKGRQKSDGKEGGKEKILLKATWVFFCASETRRSELFLILGAIKQIARTIRGEESRCN